MEKVTFDPQEWQVAVESGSWQVAYLGYSQRFASLTGMERHMQTDEVFVLLHGNAELYVEDEKEAMKPGVVYNVRKGQWHHIVVSPDAAVLIVENTGTSLENTERRPV